MAAMTVARLERFAAAWARGDVDELMTFMTDDSESPTGLFPRARRRQ
jgi:hypothetical protein